VDDARAAGLLQLRSLTSHPLLRFSSARPSRSSHARPSELRQQMLYRAPWRLPMPAYLHESRPWWTRLKDQTTAGIS
jgi:hypothetical protein